MSIDFSTITERAGDPVTPGQLADMAHRYRWASDLCRGKRVLEVACGTGQGLGMLGNAARTVAGCDIDEGSVALARAAYASRFEISVAAANELPAADGSLDALLLFEALYYLPEPAAFLREVRRVLAPGGVLLITTNNPDLFDFVPSPLSQHYYGALALRDLLGQHGFDTALYGYGRDAALPLRHRLLRPLKALAARAGLVPKTMRGKAVLRRLLFGRLPPMPADLAEVGLAYAPPAPISTSEPDREHRFIYAVARRSE